MIRMLVVIPLMIPLLNGCPGRVLDLISDGNWQAVRVDGSPTVFPVAVVVADMDDDGDLDIVSIWRGDPQDPGKSGLLAIHIQLSPTLWDTVIIDSGDRYAEASGLTVGDVNLDGNLDIVVAAMDRIIYLSAPTSPANAAGWDIFDIAASIGDDFDAWVDVVVAQIDGEDGLDIVAALADDGRVVWLESPEDPDREQGWLLFNINAATRSQANSVALLDLDEDDLLDVISTAPGESTAVVSWFEHPDDPERNEWIKHPISNFAGATRLALGDLDRDGRQDIATISPTDRRVVWLKQPVAEKEPWSGLVLADFSNALDGRVPTDVAIADIDSDGQNDVVIASAGSGQVSWFTPGVDNRMPWIENPIVRFLNASPALIDVGDIDRDNDVDVVVPVDDSGFDIRDRVNWYANPLGGTIGAKPF